MDDKPIWKVLCEPGEREYRQLAWILVFFTILVCALILVLVAGC
jgi:hypothetical protein